MTTGTDDTKVCPYCAEVIKAAAVKCRYCQSDLTGEAPVPVPVPAAPAQPAPVPVKPVKQPKPRKPVGKASPRLLVTLAALLVLSLVAAVVAGLLAWDLRKMRATDDAESAALVTAEEYVKQLLSYSYKTFEDDEADKAKLTTGDFGDEFAKTMDLVRDDAIDTKTVVKAEVVATSVVDAEPDEVKALLFVNQTTTGKQVEEPRFDQNRVVVTMTQTDDGWRISGLDAL